jgi:membrane-bound lytic murein transglycosylase B
MKAQGPALERAERELGVPSEIIAAIIGVETYYGRIAGSYRVIDALSTLAFDYPKRAPFFRKELVAYLTLAREQNIDPLQPVGSYAGAMGYSQFMPSSYRAYAIDFDGDEFIDIWGNPVDAIGSVANYLKRHGWKEGQPIAQTLAPDQFMSADWLSDGLKLPYTVAELPLPTGVIPVGLPSNASIKPLQLETMNGPQQWLVFNNFYTITRYNHSSMYAMAVTELADALAAGLQAQ